MRSSVLLAVIVLAIVARAQEDVDLAQTAPVRAYIQAVLSDDVEAFKEAHTERALQAYEQSGGFRKLFEQAKLEIPKKFRGAELADFSFSAERAKYATSAQRLDLDGEYFMVMARAKGGGFGVFVESEQGDWKITIPRYKNLDALLEQYKSATGKDPKPNKAAAADR